MRIENVFPIPIMVDEIDMSLIDDTLDKVNQFISDTGFCIPPAPGELLTTFYDNKNFLGNIGAYKLTEIINQRTREYFEILGLDSTAFIEVTSWLQYNQPGSYFIRHDHYGAITSGVIYLHVPEDCGGIVFHNPLEARRCTTAFFQKIQQEENDYNFNHVKIIPKKGEMLIFEPWLQHTVQQNKSNESRISIGFNIWAAPNVKR